jgi:hypothetical protein
MEFQANTERTYTLDLFEMVEEEDGGDEGDGALDLVHVQQYDFLQPVYRYYEHFADLQWNIAGSSTTTTSTAVSLTTSNMEARGITTAVNGPTLR